LALELLFPQRMRGEAAMSTIQDRWLEMRQGMGSAGKTVADPAGRGGRESRARIVIAGPADERRLRWIEQLQETFDVCPVAERRSLDLVMARLTPEVLVIDLALPGMGHVREISDVQESSPSTRVVALTSTATESEGLLALRAGARAYCPRTIEPRQLEKAVAAVQQGEIWTPRWLLSGIITEWLSLVELLETRGQQLLGHPRLDNLTARQRAVAYLIGRGACNKEIAERLNITERTVKAHLTEAFRNAGVSDRLQLALLVKGRPPHPGSRAPAR
jgi:DNA-binding NarL/FixJ family response regulator